MDSISLTRVSSVERGELLYSKTKAWLFGYRFLILAIPSLLKTGGQGRKPSIRGLKRQNICPVQLSSGIRRVVITRWLLVIRPRRSRAIKLLQGTWSRTVWRKHAKDIFLPTFICLHKSVRVAQFLVKTSSISVMVIIGEERISSDRPTALAFSHGVKEEKSASALGLNLKSAVLVKTSASSPFLTVFSGRLSSFRQRYFKRSAAH